MPPKMHMRTPPATQVYLRENILPSLTGHGAHHATPNPQCGIPQCPPVCTLHTWILRIQSKHDSGHCSGDQMSERVTEDRTLGRKNWEVSWEEWVEIPQTGRLRWEADDKLLNSQGLLLPDSSLSFEKTSLLPGSLYPFSFLMPSSIHSSTFWRFLRQLSCGGAGALCQVTCNGPGRGVPFPLPLMVLPHPALFVNLLSSPGHLVTFDFLSVCYWFGSPNTKHLHFQSRGRKSSLHLGFHEKRLFHSSTGPERAFPWTTIFYGRVS